MQYFATLTEEKDYLPALMQRVKQWDQWLDSSGVGARWDRVMKVYHGLKPDDFDGSTAAGRLRRFGKKGELTELISNHFRNLTQHVHVLVTSNRPAFQARAANSDHKSQVGAQLGNGVLDYYLREKRLELNLKRACEHAILWGEGHVCQLWNPALGDPYIPTAEGTVAKTGDVETWNPLPNDVWRDVNAKDFETMQWKGVRFWANKYDLAVRFPQRAEDILKVGAGESEDRNLRQYDFETMENDLIPCFWFFHEKSDAVPQGKMTLFVETALLVDGGLDYDGVPIFSVMPSPVTNMPVGYTPAFDALPLQEMINRLGSSICSNQSAFAVQNVWVKPGSNTTVTQVQGGLNLIESVEKPEPLQLCATPAEVPQFRQQLISEMETLFGINSVVRGNPEANLKSGAAVAFVASQAVQFMSGLQGSYNLLIEAVGTGTLRLLRRYAKAKRVANIVGIKGRGYQKEFSGSDLDAVRSVTVAQAPAIMSTPAGKMEVATQLREMGAVRRPEEYLSVLLTGNLDPMTEDDSAKLLLIRAENEELLNGGSPFAHVAEMHADHIIGHLNVLASPEAKRDPSLVERTLAHVQEHLELWRNADPAILMLTGQQPPPPPGMMPGQAPMGSEGQPTPEIGGAPNESKPEMPNMPGLPQGSPEGAENAYAQMNPQLTPQAAQQAQGVA